MWSRIAIVIGTVLALVVTACGGEHTTAVQETGLDPSFDQDGLLTRDVFGRTDIAGSVLIPRAGGMLVGGYADHDNYGRRVSQLVLRLRDDGSPDPSFGRDGVLRVSRGLSGMVEQADGKLLMIGSAHGSAAVARRLVDGSPDTTFGRRGVSVIPHQALKRADCSGVAAAAVLHDGRIVVLGGLGCGGESGGHLQTFRARLLPNGALDRSFARSGVHISRRSCGVGGVAQQLDDRVVIAENTGSSDYCTGGAMFLTRLRRDGGPDVTFANRGRKRMRFEPRREAWATRLVIDAQGRIVVAGAAGDRVGVARLLPNGTFDRSFGVDGRVTRQTRHRAENFATGLALDVDGRVTVSAYDELRDTQRFVVLRFNTGGQPDRTFGPHGMQVVSFGSDFARAEDVAIDAQGRTVVTGMSYTDASMADFAIARLR